MTILEAKKPYHAPNMGEIKKRQGVFVLFRYAYVLYMLPPLRKENGDKIELSYFRPEVAADEVVEPIELEHEVLGRPAEAHMEAVGGGVDAETIQAAIIRELREELLASLIDPDDFSIDFSDLLRIKELQILTDLALFSNELALLTLIDNLNIPEPELVPELRVLQHSAGDGWQLWRYFVEMYQSIIDLTTDQFEELTRLVRLVPFDTNLPQRPYMQSIIDKEQERRAAIEM